jgi:hypothetical protein
MYDKLYVWHNLNNDTYYYKVNSGTYKNYKVGDKNSYNHELVLIVENEVLKPVIEKKYVSIRKMVLTPIIVFLQKINKD